MRGQELLDKLSLIDPRYIEEAEKKKQSARHGLRTAVIAAAALLVIFCGANLLPFLFQGAGCSSPIGTIVDGVYYYYEPHRGVYAYEGFGRSRKVLSAFGTDWWEVNDYGIYYTHGNRLSVRPHGSRKKQLLLKADGWTHLADLRLLPDGSVGATALRGDGTQTEFLLDGRTGELLREPAPPHSIFDPPEAETRFALGERRLELVPLFPEDPHAASRLDLRENGVSLLPEGCWVTRDIHFTPGERLLLLGETKEDSRFIAVFTPQGEHFFPMESSYYSSIFQNVVGDFLFYPGSDGPAALSLLSGESRALPADRKTVSELYYFTTDGRLLYATAPWESPQECWRVEYGADGFPARLVLLDDNIRDKNF